MLRPCQKLILAAILLSLPACKNWRPGIFVQRSPREQYALDIQKTASVSAAAAARWLADGDSALRHPATITLPYRETGIFPRSANGAVALQFEAQQGEQIIVKSSAPDGRRAAIFLELHRGAATDRAVYPEAGDAIVYNIDQSGRFSLLLQGVLDSPAAYTVTLAARPSLAYPATNPAKNRIGSVWGDARDGGARRHEGVDIFAPKGSPALAASSGRITRLTNGGIGGKTVWLRPDNHAVSLYYAHLDSQWVREGDYVRTGDTLGQIGNTGNARYTAAHLHFGIYTSGGAINPAPFIRFRDTATRASGVPADLPGTLKTLREPVALRSGPGADSRVLRHAPSGTQVLILARTADQIRMQIADSITGWTSYRKSLFVPGSRRTD